MEEAMEALSELLCFTGALLFLFGLLTGFGIPGFRSPRIGLSAHLAAIESGLGLIAFGLLLPHLALSPTWATVIAQTLWISLYVLWIGLVFGAAFGTGKALPIAGAGHEASPAREMTARILVGGGSLGSAAAVAALLVQWRWVG
jgi:hydroxylaminobenzene mutase